MNYSKMRYIEDFDLSTIKEMNDFPERLNLVKSWLGQWNYLECKAIERSQRRIDTNRRVKRDQYKCIEHYENLRDAWMDKIERCLAGEPLDQVKGKVKVATSMPPSTKHSARYHIHQERLQKKRAKRRAKRAREQQLKESEQNVGNMELSN